MASTALRRPVGHEDRLSLVDHLDELRSRLIVAVLALVFAFGICFWQNGPLLHFINRPLESQTTKAVHKGQGPLGATFESYRALRGMGAELDATLRALERPDSGAKPAARLAFEAQRARLKRTLAALPRDVTGNKPVTLGVGEPFSATARVAFYFSLLFSLPFLLWQLYAFVLPAFSPAERRVAIPLLTMIPALFIMGVAVGYFLVLPAAVRFLQNFNADQFNILIQARDYYKFATLTLIAMWIVFQVPVGILALTRFGVLKLDMLRRNRRYALVICAVVAVPLPGTDPVSMILEWLMLYLLYEVGIVLSRIFGRPVSGEDDEPEDSDIVAS